MFSEELIFAVLTAIPLRLRSLYFEEIINHYLESGNKTDAQSEFLATLARPAKKIIFYLPTLTRLYPLLELNSTKVVKQFAAILEELAKYAPENSRYAALQVDTLLQVFRPDLALKAINKNSSLFSLDALQKWQNIAERNWDLLNFFNIDLKQTWLDSFSNLGHKDIIFHIPGVFRCSQLEFSDFYKSIIEITYNIYRVAKELHGENISLLFQFNWKTILEFSKDQIIYSYHTRGENIGTNIRFKESALVNYFTIDSKGYAGWHSMAETKLDDILESQDLISKEEIEQKYSNLYQEFVSNNVSKYPQINNFKENIFEPNSYYFLPLQIIDDDVAELASINTLDLCSFLIKLANNNKIKLIIKRHPKCDSPKIRRLLEIASSEPNILVSNSSIHSLVKNCRAVITVNSGVGLEALLQLKPVILTGRADYQAICFVAKTKEELQELLNSDLSVEPDNIKAFLNFYDQNIYRYDDIDKIRAALLY